MLCELCGMEAKQLHLTQVEGTTLRLCPNCARYGKEIVKKQPAPPPEPQVEQRPVVRRQAVRPRKRGPKNIYEQITKDLVEDYHKRIIEARMKRDWSQEDLGKKINEKKSVIAMLESKSMKPDDKLVRKLEKTLDITLMEESKEFSYTAKSGSRGLTIGDLIRSQRD